MKRTLSLSAFMLMTTSPVFSENVIFLDEILVEATLLPTEWWRSAATINTTDYGNLNSSGSSDLISTLNSTPGISIRRFGGIGGTSFATMRGLQPQYFSVYRDGIEITDPSSVQVQYTDFGSIPNSSISSLQILKGTQSALYGSSTIAGVMSIKTNDFDKSPAGSSHTIDFSVGPNNSTNSAYSFTQNTDGLSLGLAANNYKTDGISSASTSRENFPTGQKNTEKDGFEGSSISFHAKLNLTDNITIGGNIFREQNEYEFDEGYADNTNGIYGPVDGNSPTDEKGTKKADGARLFAEFKSGIWTHNLSATSYFVNRTAVQVGSGADTDSYADKYKGTRETIQYVASAELNSHLNISFGTDKKTETSDTSTLPNGKTSASTNGIFTEIQYLPTEKLSIIANARIDDHSQFGKFTSYRLSPSYKITDNTVIRAQASTGYRAPSIYELYGRAPSPIGTYLGNPNLKPETSKSIEVGLDHYIPGGGIFSITKYETVLRDLIDTKWSAYNSASIHPKYNKPNDKLTISSGTEVSLRLPLSVQTNFGMAFMSTSCQNISSCSEAGAQVSMTLNHSFTDKFSAAAQSISVSDRGDGWYGARKDYQLINASANYKINDSLLAYVKVENVADTEYELDPGYSAPRRTVFAGIRASF